VKNAMNTQLKQAIRNLRSNPARTMLVILALIIGLWGLGSLLVSFTILRNDLATNYSNTLPPHAIIVSKDFNQLNLAELRNRSEIESAEFRDLSMERIEIVPNHWVPLWIFGVEDFSYFNLAKFYTQEGKKVPDPGTMLIERNGQKISTLKTGSQARISVYGPKIIEVPISGISFDPALAPSTMDHWIYAYVDQKTYSDLTGKQINQRLILRFDDVATQQDVEHKTQKVLNDLKKMRISIDKISVPKLNEHPHQFQLDSLMILHGGIGLLSFLMGAILVWQLMGSMLASQVRQIGVLKAVGASSLQIFNIYLTLILIMGIVATGVALPLAVGSGFAFADFVSEQLNFEVLTTSLPIQVYFYLIGAGLSLPVLSSLTVLIKAIKIPVVAALADYGIKSPSSKNKTASRLPLASQLVMVLRNTLRRRTRLAVTVASLALGVAIFSTGFNLRQAMIALLDEMNNAMGYDVQVILREQVPVSQALFPFEAIQEKTRIETWSGGKGTLHSRDTPVLKSSDIIALPYDTDLIKPEIIQGRWLKENDQLEIVINSKMLEVFNNPTIGEKYYLDIFGKTLTVRLVGIVKQLGIPAIYIDQKKFNRLLNTEGLVNSILLTSKYSEVNHQAAMQESIEKILETSDLNIASVTSNARLIRIIYDHLDVILRLLTFLAFLVLIVSGLGMASATSINIMERTREIGILKAIGATTKKINSILIGEGMVISFLSIIIGLMLSWPMSVIVSDFFGNLILETGLNFAFSKTGFAITLTVTLCFSWLASKIPAMKAVKISTQDALSYE